MTQLVTNAYRSNRQAKFDGSGGMTRMTPAQSKQLAVIAAARALLEVVETISAADFAKGLDRPERQALRLALAELDKEQVS